MKKHFTLKNLSFSGVVGVALVSICCKGSESSSQYDEQFQADIRTTGMVHSPLPLDYSKAYETFGFTKKVLVNETLGDMEDLSLWTHRGIGSMSQTAERSISGKHSLRLTAPTRIHPTTWIQEMPAADVFWGLGLGSSRAILELGGVNWENYNRIRRIGPKTIPLPTRKCLEYRRKNGFC